MSFSTKKAKSSNFESPEADFHDGIIAGLVDFGEVTVEYEGQKKVQDKIAIMYYLNTTKTDGETRFLLTTSYNFSFNAKATLFKHLSSAFGSDIKDCEDLSELLGKRVRILVEHVEKKDGSGTYAKVDSLRPAKDETVNMDGFELPQWIKDENEKGLVQDIAIFGED